MKPPKLLLGEEEVARLARSLGINPSRLRGQHYLVDKGVLAEIVATADIQPEDRILEIGPGFGVLTQELAKLSRAVLAVETEERVVKWLKKSVVGTGVVVEHQDILAVKNSDIEAKLKGPGWRLISNIPYSITGEILRKFVSDSLPKPKDAVLLVQKEVAERVCALPGRMSILAVSVQLYSQPEFINRVSRLSFWPVPKVDSAILCISDIQDKPRYQIKDLDNFWRILRIGFSSPRKQVHNNIASGLHCTALESKALLIQAGINPTSRSQELAVEDWVRLAEAVT